MYYAILWDIYFIIIVAVCITNDQPEIFIKPYYIIEVYILLSDL